MFIFIFLLLLNSNEIFNTANEHYKNQEFDLALEGYIKLEKETKSLELYYNIANTYFRLNKLGLAKAYYLKVLKYQPNNKDALHNLRVIDSVLGTQEQEATIDKIKRYISLNFLAFLNLFLFIIFLILSFMFIRNYKKNKNITVLMFFLINVFVIFILSIVLTYFIYNTYNKKEAVLIKDSTLFSEPNNNSKELVSIREGTRLIIEACSNNWCKVVYDKKLIAWIENDNFMEF